MPEPQLVAALKRLATGHTVPPKLYAVLRHKGFAAMGRDGAGRARITVSASGRAWLAKREARS